MIYTTGTVNTVSGSAIVKGTGTKFKNNNPAINIGMTILIKSGNTNIPYMIKSVNSDTELVLAQPALATATNTTFSIHITEPDNNSDAARTMVAINSYVEYFLDAMNTWMTQTGQTKIEMPNGEVVTLDSIKKMQGDIAAKLSPGDFGVGTNARGKVRPTEFVQDANLVEDSGFTQPDGGRASNFFDYYAPMLTMVRYGGNDGTGRVTQFQCARNNVAFRTRDSMNWSEWLDLMILNKGGLQKLDGSLVAQNHRIGANPISATRDGNTYVNMYPPRNNETEGFFQYNIGNDWSGMAKIPKVSSGKTETLMLVGDYGWGSHGNDRLLRGTNEQVIADYIKSNTSITSTWRDNESETKYAPRYSSNLLVRTADTYFNICCAHNSQNIIVTSGSSQLERIRYIWNTGNTTTDSNGFIKKASPIIDINPDGSFTTNDESEGATVTRVAKGEYLIEGVLGFNSDADWGGVDGGIEIPLDVNKQPLIWVNSKVNKDGSILVKTYHRTYPNAPEFANNTIDGFKDGDPIDIPDGRFISVRVQMPEQSIYNVRMREMEEAQKAEEERRQKEEEENQGTNSAPEIDN
ncbi:TPA: hypothetical protein ACXN3T_001256 [Proteus mirabilis]